MTSRRALGIVAAFSIALSACSPAPAPDAGKAAPAEPAVPPGLEAGAHTYRTADGNEMPYTVSGSGDTTVLLVHCWMCDATFWDAQVPELAKLYRTITVDLPGHGKASANRAEWTVAGYGEDVAGLIRQLDLSNVVLVGHSMGGPVALKAAALSKPRIKGIVAVDTLHDAEFDFSGPQIDGFLKAFDADFSGTCNGFIGQMIPEAGAEAVVAKVKQAGCDESRKAVGTALMHNFGAIDMETWFQEAGVPIRAINAAAPNPTKIETNKKYADFDAVTMEGVGHYLHMTRPAEFNPLLLSTIAKLTTPAS